MPIIPLLTVKSHFSILPLEYSEVQLKTYMKEKLPVQGQHDVTMKYGDQVKKLQ